MDVYVYKKTHGVKRSDSALVHLTERVTLKTMCGKELNWRWELGSAVLEDVLSLSQDIYCANCIKAFEARPAMVKAA